MKLKRVHNVLLATLMTCVMVAVPVFATPDNGTVTQKDALQELNEQKQNLETQKSTVENEVSDLQTQLGALLSKMNELQNQLIQKGQEIVQAREDLAAAEAKEEQQYADMKLRIKYMYEEGSNSALERIVSSGSISEVLSQAEYVEKVHTYDRQMLKEYTNTVQQVESLKASLESELVQLEDIQSQYEAQSVELDETIQAKSAEVADLDIQIQEAARRVAEEEERRRKEEEERQRREEEERRRKEEEEQRRKEEEERQRQQVVSNNNQNQDSVASGSPVQTFVPDYNQSAAEIIVAAAWSQVGVAMYGWGMQIPYVSFDCSGLTQWCYRQAGISIPRTDITQLNAGTIVKDPMPGDICWTPGHVAIYIGNGQMIEAQQTGVPVCVSKVRVTYYVRY